MREAKHIAIVLAAGKGSRMKSDIPKQYMLIGEKPILYYSLQAFQKNTKISEIILVTRIEDLEYCKEKIVKKYNFTKVKEIVAGGKERYNSVYEALKVISKKENLNNDIKTNCYVHIHDGARPMLTQTIIDNCIENVEKYEAIVTAVKVKDTIKVVKDNQIESTPDRNTLWQIQTPQSFEVNMIKSAYKDIIQKIQNKDDNLPTITDDAMILENYNNRKITISEGDYKNIKVTTPEDIIIAECFIASDNK
ncbi:2-C-methyl-D-erythritol 4-phosphate cytidylyltransferase [Lachnobacterium bovis]|uniref:2-C-methyl-D-erythritol 4-phosphate cytidylyltransferase n=1 Tax=Lachnobacterium bovis TaxID=140626 RepID=A0A1H9RMK1_9FIRM|nr:2-C-methyl-D-erythritol 4-phosphate cytidylyltransferase [Lachnobacterium bovis]SER73954.1 2-C-methyl-D-erythritol 4-phosphate cytidylyltransferase [Lachnobacterium bovis]